MTTRHKVLITGGNGQLSADLAQVFDSPDTVVLNREALDISRLIPSLIICLQM